jgi:hypothetical protein
MCVPSYSVIPEKENVFRKYCTVYRYMQHIGKWLTVATTNVNSLYGVRTEIYLWTWCKMYFYITYNQKVGDKMEFAVYIWHMLTVLLDIATETDHKISVLLIIWGLKLIYVILKNNSFNVSQKTHTLLQRQISLCYKYSGFTGGCRWTVGLGSSHRKVESVLFSYVLDEPAASMFRVN